MHKTCFDIVIKIINNHQNFKIRLNFKKNYSIRYVKIIGKKSVIKRG